MTSWWFWAFLIPAGFGVVQSLLLALQTWEHRRYVRSGVRHAQRHRPSGRALVVCPCKGIDVNVAENLRALFRQDYEDYELRFVVESAADPACEAIRRVIAEHPEQATRLVIAGLAAGSGQKIHNLRSATAQLPPQIKYLAFVDSDAQPRPEWLRLLVARLHRSDVGAATGYRWFVPARPSLANCLVYSINCRAMVLLGRCSYYLVWGGSWAISRERFRSLAVRQAWQGALSDDLVLSELLREAKLPSRFEPVAVVASPLDLSWRQMLAFLRRQYMFGRYHVPGWWLLGLGGVALGNLAWGASLVGLGFSLCCGKPLPWLAAGLCAALYAVAVCRGLLRQSLVQSHCPEQQAALRRPRRFDIWADPLVGLVNALGMFGSILGRHIRWRGIDYRLVRGGRIRVVCHGNAANSEGKEGKSTGKASGAQRVSDESSVHADPRLCRVTVCHPSEAL